MRIRTCILILCCLLAASAAVPALAPAQTEGAPQVCLDALKAQDPQTQVVLYTRCLDTGQLDEDQTAKVVYNRGNAYGNLG
ncbi:MAG: hypothetical protein Q7U56_05470, partial [Humidesulfovibrio sp.]|nr:hypothetical protein [Humidesulfovibrio sp.]